MIDPMTLLTSLHRPRLLIRAARFGLADYNRERDLKRLTHSARALPSRQVLNTLISEEGQQEEKRIKGDAAYSIARHIELLVALIAEARLFVSPARD